MSESLFVLTGGSRGMGAAMAVQLLQPGHVVISIARGEQASMAERAREHGAVCEQWAMDLSDARPVAEKLSVWLASQNLSRFGRVALINNAGMISRVGPVDEDTAENLATALRVGLEAPLLLSAAFLRGTRDWGVERRILNISSGLGRRAMAGSASYCAAKAGMDHLSRAMALDEAARPNGARIVSLAPGVIDTDMQTQLRDGDPSGFPEQQNFVNLKQSGQLTSPADAAARALAYLERDDFGSNVVADIRG
jgi:benzil reductase ((S)-benzoin forming)